MAHMEMNGTTETTTLVPAWRDLLVRESDEIDHAGVQAAVLSVRLVGTDPAELIDDARRAESLLVRRLKPTDRLAVTSQKSFSLLLSPTVELLSLIHI